MKKIDITKLQGNQVSDDGDVIPYEDIEILVEKINETPMKDIKEFNFADSWKEVDFFLRIHRHLPDHICGGNVLSPCEYRVDGRAINAENDYVEELQLNLDFRAKEKEVLEAQKNGKSIYVKN